MQKIIDNLNRKKPLIIQGAMDSEICLLVQSLDNCREEKMMGFSYFTGTLCQYPVIVSRTCQGMTNAAASTILAIEHFSPALIINQGICGGHSPELHRGDILLGKEIMNYSNLKIDSSPLGTPIGCEVFSAVSPETPLEKKTCFYSHAGLLALAQSCPHPESGGKILTGKIGSADAWLDRKELIARMNETFKTCGEDMETASAAQLCHCFDLPFLSIRMLSNTRVYDEDYDESVSETLQEYTLNVIRKILA